MDPPFFQIAVELSPLPAPPDPTRASAVVRDALHKAVLDFEETLQRSHPKQITYTTIPDSPGQGTTADFTEAGEFPSLSTLPIQDRESSHIIWHISYKIEHYSMLG
jgi:hypothetical protein